MSRADWKRSPGFFSRQCCTMRCSAGDAPGAGRPRSPAGPPSGSPSCSRSPSRARTPAAPSASRRGRRRTRRCPSGDPPRSPRTCSGDMYLTVPITVPGSVCSRPSAGASPRRCAGPVLFARPKSSTFTRPSPVTKMFSGFRSRWTIPFSWAAASPSAICAARSTALRAGSAPCASRARSVSPSSSSMTA